MPVAENARRGRTYGRDRIYRTPVGSAGCPKTNNQLMGWIKSIISHFWWSSAACQKNAVIIREKWFSVLQRVSNKHDWEGNQFYHSCEHGPCSNEEERT